MAAPTIAVFSDGNEDIATRFLAGVYKGWAFCRDNPEECVQFTVDAGSTLGLGHQRWMMNEINPLIWPSPDGIGSMPVDTYETTVQIMLDAGLISEAPGEDAQRSASSFREGRQVGRAQRAGLTEA